MWCVGTKNFQNVYHGGNAPKLKFLAINFQVRVHEWVFFLKVNLFSFPMNTVAGLYRSALARKKYQIIHIGFNAAIKTFFKINLESKFLSDGIF